MPYLIHCLNHVDEPEIIAVVLARLTSLKANKAITECLCQILKSGLHKSNYDNYVGGRLLRIIKVLDEASLADVIDFAIKNGIRYRDGLLLAAKRSQNTAVRNQYALFAGDSGIDTELVEMIKDQAILATVVCSHTLPNSDKAYEKITEQSALTYIAMHDMHYHWFADAVKRLTGTDSIVEIMTRKTKMDDVQIEAHSPYSRLRWYVLLSVLGVDERDTSFVRELLDNQDYKGIYEFINTMNKSFSHEREGR